MGVFLTTVVTKELDPLSLEHTTYWVYMLKYYGQLNTGLGLARPVTATKRCKRKMIPADNHVPLVEVYVRMFFDIFVNVVMPLFINMSIPLLLIVGLYDGVDEMPAVGDFVSETDTAVSEAYWAAAVPSVAAEIDRYSPSYGARHSPRFPGLSYSSSLDLIMNLFAIAFISSIDNVDEGDETHFAKFARVTVDVVGGVGTETFQAAEAVGGKGPNAVKAFRKMVVLASDTSAEMSAKVGALVCGMPGTPIGGTHPRSATLLRLPDSTGRQLKQWRAACAQVCEAVLFPEEILDRKDETVGMFRSKTTKQKKTSTKHANARAVRLRYASRAVQLHPKQGPIRFRPPTCTYDASHTHVGPQYVQVS